MGSKSGSKAQSPKQPTLIKSQTLKIKIKKVTCRYVHICHKESMLSIKCRSGAEKGRVTHLEHNVNATVAAG